MITDQDWVNLTPGTDLVFLHQLRLPRADQPQGPALVGNVRSVSDKNLMVEAESWINTRISRESFPDRVVEVLDPITPTGDQGHDLARIRRRLDALSMAADVDGGMGTRMRRIIDLWERQDTHDAVTAYLAAEDGLSQEWAPERRSLGVPLTLRALDGWLAEHVGQRQVQLLRQAVFGS